MIWICSIFHLIIIVHMFCLLIEMLFLPLFCFCQKMFLLSRNILRWNEKLIFQISNTQYQQFFTFEFPFRFLFISFQCCLSLSLNTFSEWIWNFGTWNPNNLSHIICAKCITVHISLLYLCTISTEHSDSACLINSQQVADQSKHIAMLALFDFCLDYFSIGRRLCFILHKYIKEVRIAFVGRTVEYQIRFILNLSECNCNNCIWNIKCQCTKTFPNTHTQTHIHSNFEFRKAEKVIWRPFGKETIIFNTESSRKCAINFVFHFYLLSTMQQ